MDKNKIKSCIIGAQTALKHENYSLLLFLVNKATEELKREISSPIEIPVGLIEDIFEDDDTEDTADFSYGTSEDEINKTTTYSKADIRERSVNKLADSRDLENLVKRVEELEKESALHKDAAILATKLAVDGSVSYDDYEALKNKK